MPIVADLHTRVVVAKDGVARCEIDAGMALLDLEQSLYFALNPVAAFIWEKIQTPVPIGDVVAAVRNQFEAGDQDIAADVTALIADLTAKDLVRVQA